MSQAKQKILQEIRYGLGRAELSPNDQHSLEQRLRRNQANIQPHWEQDVQTRLLEKFAEASITYQQVTSTDEAPQAIAEFLREHNLPAKIIAAPELQGMVWPESLELEYGAAHGHHQSSVTACICAVAETGSLVLASSASPTSLNFLPENHLVVLHKSQIYPHLEAGWECVKQANGGEVPRTVNFISGPSRTGDIEQTIELGAHGPRRLHVILVDDSPA